MATKTSQTRKSAGKRSARKRAEAREQAHGVDLSTLDRDELLQLQKDVDQALRTFEKRKREEALIEMEAVARKHGLSLKDVTQNGSGRPPAAPKYRHPENPALTWSGRGRQPTWYKEAIEAGTEPEHLLIA